MVLLQSSATVCQNDPSLNTAIGHCDRWKQLLRLVNDVLSPLDLSQSAVALVSYADDANVEFDFQRCVFGFFLKFVKLKIFITNTFSF